MAKGASKKASKKKPGKRRIRIPRPGIRRPKIKLSKPRFRKPKIRISRPRLKRPRIPKPKLKISKPHIPKPRIKISAPRIPKRKKKRIKFAGEKKQLLESIREHNVNADTKMVGRALSFIAGIPRIPSARGERLLVEKAFSFSEEKHRRQKRLSGDPYFTHAFQTAHILSDYGLDSNTIAAALLHDVLEDTDVKDEEIRKMFGEEVLSLVRGVTKLEGYGRTDLELAERDYLKSLLSASSKDVRILLIKLADKLHNLRTIGFLGKKRSGEICENTLEVYAPLAERLGIHSMEGEMEDICLKVLRPAEFRKLSKRIEKKRVRKEREIDEAVKELSAVKVGLRKTFFQKHSRRKWARNIYSFYKKTAGMGKTLDELYDFVSLVILCDTTHDCYDALETVHSKFHPLPGKFKDLIAAPKHLTYRSISTSVIGPLGAPIKIFIRTREMDDLAENGITVWLRGHAELSEAESEQFSEFSSMPEGQEEFASALKTDFLEGQVGVFGPQGRKFLLPKGSTPVDFAFKFSPKKAPKLAQVEINGRAKPVWSKLNSGDRIHPFYSRDKTIEREWLDFAKTYYAREMIKDELNIAGAKAVERFRASYSFTAKPRKGLLEEISVVLGNYNAELELFTIGRVAPGRFEGKISFSLEKKGSEQGIIGSLARVKGLSELKQEM